MPIFEPDSDTVTGPLVPGAPEEEVLDGDEIQGAVLPGFGTSFQHLFALRFPDSVTLRSFLGSSHARVTSLNEAVEQRNSRRTALRGGFARPATPVMRGVSLSIAGLRMVRRDADSIKDTPFKAGMKARSPYLQDPTAEGIEGNPTTWLFGGTDSTVPHVVVVLAAECRDELTPATNQLRTFVAELGTVVWEQLGSVLPGEKEHFGFRDGISQVGVRGRLSDSPRHFLTRRWFDPADTRAREYARPGQPLVWPGQFVFGCHRGDPLEALSPGEVAPGGPEWTRNGSLLVLRRLRQDVDAFRRFTTKEAGRLRALPGFADITRDKLEAKIVGRWPDGTPLARNLDQPDPTTAKDMMGINAFGYSHDWAPAAVCADPQVTLEPLVFDDAPVDVTAELRTTPGAVADPDGVRCPAFAHIRKVNPRDRNTDQGDPLLTRQFQMLRRGITWGDPYSTDVADDDGNRGLLFMSYQTSISRGFEMLTLKWMNNEDPPENPSGADILVGLDSNQAPRRARLRSDDSAHPGAGEPLATPGDTAWIIATGGEYLFAPSRSALQLFAAREDIGHP